LATISEWLSSRKHRPNTLIKKRPLYITGGYVNKFDHHRNQYWGSLKKPKIGLPYDPLIPTLAYIQGNVTQPTVEMPAHTCL
jgi:hypothetical protein